MVATNLFLLTRNYDKSIITEYENIMSHRVERLEYRECEHESLCTLVETLKNDVEISKLDGFHIGYEINQISKEFDLLKVEQGKKVLNIELKSMMHEEKLEKYKRTLLRNKYYLGHIADNIYVFMYDSNRNILFTLDEERLVEVPIADLVEIINDFMNYEEEINKLFTPSMFLISPLNSSEMFLERKYFLTDLQERIKSRILEGVDGRITWGITGSAGTGKTLLLYDLVFELSSKGKVCVVHTGQVCEGHAILDMKMPNVDIIPAKEIEGKFLPNIEKYQYIAVDEMQRIYEEQYYKIIQVIKEKSITGIFSYDSQQVLAYSEQNRNIIGKLAELECFKENKLTEKIRTNKEISTFIKILFDLKQTNNIWGRFDKIDIIKANTVDEANNIIDYFRIKRGYTFIHYTKSRYRENMIDHYHGDFDTHEVIGQEFDNVVIIMDRNFQYNVDGKLQTYEHPYYNYIFSKLFFQGITRARDKLCIVVVDNDEIFKKLIGIKFNYIKRVIF